MVWWGKLVDEAVKIQLSVSQVDAQVDIVYCR
jgi:hypothetical protein